MSDEIIEIPSRRFPLLKVIAGGLALGGVTAGIAYVVSPTKIKELLRIEENKLSLLLKR